MIGTLPVYLVKIAHYFRQLICHSFIICFLCEFYAFEVEIYMSAARNYGLNGGRTVSFPGHGGSFMKYVYVYVQKDKLLSNLVYNFF